ncbi:flagellar basal body rod protein FlgB [Comamonas sp. NLF-1-9]|uniref:flagellar basal body rod protein FlgB n=1 Tax=Comamonas sp. NLF-1-9 TaxID=2853163 RepID=UPI001C48473B|nr:flagellar basal body rod protein FlgB [Comamonas sp. NLF-1-9]QXL84238.1 flagellar basal body rod protein FlgB [Comamonas sp. NLF-1-9]
MLDKLTSTLNLHGNALLLRSERQRLIASNIANADTPGYKARDLKFSEALRQAGALPGERAPMASGVRSSGHIPLRPGGSGGQAGKPGYAVQSEPALDGNSVNMDRERAAFMDNAVRYEATLRFINYQSRTLQSAITGQ